MMQTYTKRQRKDIHTALVAAKKYLWKPGKPTFLFPKFICCAISDAYYKSNAYYCEDGITRSQSILARDMIMDRLNTPCLEDWVKHNIGNKEYKKCSKDNFQLYRWRWLESMIEEFSK